ncbi:MAG: hypothetical protein R2911_10805 [Caldilineaceae bacterium]
MRVTPAPTASMETATPPPVASRTLCTTSTCLGLSASPPNSAPMASRSASRSAMKMRRAPWSCSACSASGPMGPAP